jgi:SulP family sulfate permease
VDRSPEQTRLLQEEGKRVHVFWLSGFIFFGSSNGLFERIRREIEGQKEKPVGYIVLDFSAVQGLDTSAVLSLVKLRNYCEERDVTLVFSGLSDAMHAAFLGAGFFGADRPHQAFATRNEAVEWCEDMVLLYHEVGEASSHTFETWLQSELGGDITFERVEPYMTRRELESGVVLFKQGEPSDSVVFQASGCVAITISGEYGRSIRLRRMLGHTVVGEMGFYRNVPRGANVVAEGASVVYILTREAFDRMQEEDSAAAAALHKLIIRLLSDRLEFANREISALH